MVLFILMSPEHYQTAASVNQASMFTASIVSSLIGFLIAETHASADPATMFYISLTSECLSLALLAASMTCGWIPAAALFGPAEDGVANGDDNSGIQKGNTLVGELVAYSRLRGVWCWILVSATVRAIHTHVLTLWTSLVRHDPSWDSEFNGLVAAMMYVRLGCGGLMIDPAVPKAGPILTSTTRHVAVPPLLTPLLRVHHCSLR